MLLEPDPVDRVRKLFQGVDRTALEQAARAQATTDLERAQREEARRRLAFLRSVDAQEKRVARARESWEDFLRTSGLGAWRLLSMPGTPEANVEFLRSAGLKVLGNLMREVAAYSEKPVKYIELIAGGNRAIGAAKARTAKTRKGTGKEE